MISRSEQSTKLRAELTRELLGAATSSPEVKKTDKPNSGIRKDRCCRSKFISNPNNRKSPEEHPNEISIMNACPHPKYRKTRQGNGISVAKITGEKK